MTILPVHFGTSHLKGWQLIWKQEMLKCRNPRSLKQNAKIPQSQRFIDIIWVGFWDHFLNSSTESFLLIASFHLPNVGSDTFIICTQSWWFLREQEALEKRNNWDNCWAASPGSEDRVKVKRWIVLGRDRRGPELCAWWTISLRKMLVTHFLLMHAECRQNISAFLFVFSTRRLDESHQGSIGWE